MAKIDEAQRIPRKKFVLELSGRAPKWAGEGIAHPGDERSSRREAGGCYRAQGAKGIGSG